MQFDPDALLDRAEAVHRVLDHRKWMVDRCGVETIGLDEVGGRVLAEAIEAAEDTPPHDYATMDGFTFDATAPYPFELIESEVFPEDQAPAIESGEAVPIATGAPLPDGANAVLRREDAVVEDGQLSGPTIEPGTYTYARGSNVEAGERLFETGERLSPKDAILLGDLGYTSIPVRERFSVGLLATGTELHEGRSTDLDSPMLAGLVRAWGSEPTYTGTVPDEEDRVKDRIEALATNYDIVLTTGGTSVGKKDYVLRALDALGDVDFHGVAIRPGKPVAVARLAETDTIVIAIPGKPVGAHTVATLIIRPFFTGHQRLPSIEATLTRTVTIENQAFEYAVPVVLDGSEAMPMGHVDSPLSIYADAFDASVLSSSTRATRADGVILTDSTIGSGETVRVIPYPVIE